MKKEHTIQERDYYDRGDIVIETKVEIERPVEVQITSMTVREIEEKIEALKQAKLDKVEAIDLQIKDLKDLLKEVGDQIDAVKIKPVPKDGDIEEEGKTKKKK